MPTSAWHTDHTNVPEVECLLKLHFYLQVGATPRPLFPPGSMDSLQAGEVGIVLAFGCVICWNRHSRLHDPLSDLPYPFTSSL